MWELAALSATFGIASAFFKPASTAIPADILPPGLLVSASSLSSLSQSLGQYLVGPLYCREPVSDCDHRATVHQRLEGGLNAALRLRIKRAGSLVQNEDAGTVRNCTSDLYHLPGAE